MMQKVIQWISNYRFIWFLFTVTALVATSQSLFLHKKYLAGGFEYNSYNNYTIFKQSFYHLIDGKDIYFPYPLEHWDIFKYSPSFALLFGVFANLPDILGLALWNLLNALILVVAVYYLPQLSSKQKGLVLMTCVIESMTAIQNEQSNGLIAGLIILAFGFCERKKFFMATLCIVLTVYIKIFGLVAFAMFLFYPEKLKIGLYTLFWFVILLFLPLVAIDLYQLKFLYRSWGRMLSQDHSYSQGLSVIGWLESWFSIYANKAFIAITGATLLMITYLRLKMYSEYFFRLLALTSILIWIVIFNHKAESPTFIIAMAGVSIWYFMRKRKWPDTVLFISAIILTTLSPTDLFPSYLRKSYIEPYILKAVPCIFIWMKIIYEMIIFKTWKPENRETGEQDGLTIFTP
ncbi:MAG TPA: glycosyltransferase family 87 protein [Saprospiraceae bacterium]|nr:glycosyltransferase family 87 protein [Saprospiraceae bacterium]